MSLRNNARQSVARARVSFLRTSFLRAGRRQHRNSRAEKQCARRSIIRHSSRSIHFTELISFPPIFLRVRRSRETHAVANTKVVSKGRLYSIGFIAWYILVLSVYTLTIRLSRESDFLSKASTNRDYLTLSWFAELEENCDSTNIYIYSLFNIKPV